MVSGDAGAAPPRRRVGWALAALAGLAALRLAASWETGFGDSEALYATYALHPQPAYLDHPGLVGALAGWVGGGTAPSPWAAHAATTALATLASLLVGVAARAAGASSAGAAVAVLGFSLCPEIALGLHALTPDLPLALAWLTALACAAGALRGEPSRFATTLLTLGAGAATGLACAAKASGLLLAAALVVTWLGPTTRARLRGPAPWLALALGAILAAPVLVWESREGFPMVVHRMVSTQSRAGVSLRNLGALLGGQLAYVTPAFLFAAWLALRSLHRERRGGEVARLLWWCAVLPGAGLAALCLWSRVAEPHWLAPAYLAVAVQFGRRGDVVPRRLARACGTTGITVAVVALVVVTTGVVPRVLGASYEPRWDLANDLHAWRDAPGLLTAAAERARRAGAAEPVVVGPHWIVCAQAAAALARAPGGERLARRVGCNGPIRDDFDRWLPRPAWIVHPTVLYVTDSRFPRDPATELPGRRVVEAARWDVMRGGRVVRTLTVTHLELDEATARGAAATSAP
ncbi:MAG: glycosyltransferase family 39 protein [Polyangiaceae bacterium]|nr:glycosyltransferase family 39 protein [Polyangiaceae bacterium]